MIADAGNGAIGVRARGGLGIVPSRTRRMAGYGGDPIDSAELQRRVAEAHAPYP